MALNEDQNLPDFYLWSNFKDDVYQNNIQTISELKINISAKIKTTEGVF